MVTNKEIRRILTLYAELLQLHEQDPRFAKLLSGAAYYTRRIKQDIILLSKGEIAKLFRPAIAKVLKELQATSTIEALDELIQLTPAGLFEMMRIKGLGGKKLGVIWKKARIDTLEGLLKACQKSKLSAIPGFGRKTETNIIKAIETYTSSRDHFRYASIADIADRLVGHLRSLCNTNLISLCGNIRRQTLTVADIEIVAAVSSNKMNASLLKKFMIIKSSAAGVTRGITLDEIPVVIYHTTKPNYYEQLFRLTGNAEHVEKVFAKVKGKTSFRSEEEIYKKAGLTYIVPEMRENVAEWNFRKTVNHLIMPADIKGIVHNHTTWSDGVDKLADFANACKQKGYEYTVISDHSKNAHYAGGLKEEKVIRQLKEIDELNKQMTSFRIFKSIECDIRVSGELDYDNSFLKNFDLVIVSIHQLLKMDEEKATKRLIKAIENPFTTIVGHMTGRLLLIRPGYPVNFKNVIDACAANNVVIEINANPYRLDMDWSQVPYAIKKGVMISINPDAHSIKEIDNIRWGVAAARKGGLTKEMTWNAKSLGEVSKWLNDRKPQ